MANYVIAVAALSNTGGDWLWNPGFRSKRRAQELTVPLQSLMQVTQQIAETGDLANSTKPMSRQQNEIGQLARSFRIHMVWIPAAPKMLTFLLPPSRSRVAKPHGDVKPESERPTKTLGRGFLVNGEGRLPRFGAPPVSRGTRASQVPQPGVRPSSGHRVDESAKISPPQGFQAAIDEVTTTNATR